MLQGFLFPILSSPPHLHPATVGNHILLAIYRIGIKHQNHPLRGSLRITPYSFIILQATGAFGPRTLVSEKMSRKLDFLTPGKIRLTSKLSQEEQWKILRDVSLSSDSHFPRGTPGDASTQGRPQFIKLAYRAPCVSATLSLTAAPWGWK